MIATNRSQSPTMKLVTQTVIEFFHSQRNSTIAELGFSDSAHGLTRARVTEGVTQTLASLSYLEGYCDAVRLANGAIVDGSLSLTQAAQGDPSNGKAYALVSHRAASLLAGLACTLRSYVDGSHWTWNALAFDAADSDPSPYLGEAQATLLRNLRGVLDVASKGLALQVQARAHIAQGMFE